MHSGGWGYLSFGTFFFPGDQFPLAARDLSYAELWSQPFPPYFPVSHSPYVAASSFFAERENYCIFSLLPIASGFPPPPPRRILENLLISHMFMPNDFPAQNTLLWVRS